MKVCGKCGVENPLTDYRFAYDRNRDKRWLGNVCRVCRRKQANKSYDRNREYRREYTRLNYKKNYLLNPLKYKIKKGELKMKWKREVMTHYGGGKAQCVICGFDNLDALCLDHINDDAWKDRKPREGGGIQFYLKIRKRGYPSGYQTLCANHNMIKEIERLRRKRGY